MTTNTPNKQVAIVTGASSGIGLGVTRALMQHGYSVVANSRNISKSKDLKLSSDLILVDTTASTNARYENYEYSSCGTSHAAYEKYRN